MMTVEAAEFRRDIGRFHDEALKQPVAITHNGRERLVILSAEEYHRLKRRDRVARKVTEMTAEELEAIGRVEMHARHNHLDAELT